MKNLGRLEEKVLSGEGLSEEEARGILQIGHENVLEIISLANQARARFKGNKINLCSIINAKSGLCGEDCAFCSQSVYHPTQIPTYPFVGEERVIQEAKEAAKSQARHFSIVMSGYAPTEDELKGIEHSIVGILRETSLEPCASLGILDRRSLTRLKKAGLGHYHHNLETARSFFKHICTTHSYEEDLSTIQMAKELGFRVCCGGLFGMGESWEHRIELAYTLKELDVDSVPINFLNPIPGTRLEKARFLTPMECLKIISLFRLILPQKDIIVCGGREVNLRDLQSMIFFAGANGMMIGGYLTTKGRKPEEDLQMVKDLGFIIA
ncbi:MAG: biotin synthase BioB [Desulfobacterota bacterium]|nr:biotin synthase BioB [Thermodesulfobacteriota bacterium]